eukprot:6070069-Pyramimonas_sp.AAC.1
MCICLSPVALCGGGHRGHKAPSCIRHSCRADLSQSWYFRCGMTSFKNAVEQTFLALRRASPPSWASVSDKKTSLCAFWMFKSSVMKAPGTL